VLLRLGRLRINEIAQPRRHQQRNSLNELIEIKDDDSRVESAAQKEEILANVTLDKP
jgi:hypothetical protein